ncbi:MAG TPA: lamin tail domain-containing protein [Pyrinomonadaceae bacterium]|jgi:hypothetical protein
MSILVRFRIAAMFAAFVLLSLSASPASKVFAQTVNPGDVIISEFRFRGPTVNAALGTDGSMDEYIELYNNTNAPITVTNPDGWAIAAFAPGSNENVTVIQIVAFVPNGTVIPARGHYLLTNDPGPPTDEVPVPPAFTYSLSGYAQGDQTYSGDIADDSGIALFRTANTFALADRLDAVGFTTSTEPNAAIYREGTPLASPGANDGQYAFFRRLESGIPQDTNNNASDFVFVSTNGGNYGGVQSTLGAPGPENRNSPIQRNATINASLLDPTVSSSAYPNRERSTAPVANGANGILFIRRTFTNNTGTTVTRLRFRAVDMTTLNSPNVHGGLAQADMRILQSAGGGLSSADGQFIFGVEGTRVETPPAQPNGGGLNSSVTVDIPGDGQLLPGESINVEFALGVQSGGKFRFLVNVEALP